jgi:hypothetical protein
MVTLSFNFAALAPVLLVLALSAFLGAAMHAIGWFVSGIGVFALGVAEAIAGGRASSSQAPRRNKGAVALRAFLYFAVCVGAVVFSSLGYPALAYLCAVIGGFTLSIAAIKLVF